MAGEGPSSPRVKPASVLVVGGGIAGMRAALDLADSGLKVHLIERTPCLGGRVAQLGFMFPQHDCVLCRGTADHGYGCTRPSISPAYIHHNQHPNIEILTQTEVLYVEGQAGDFSISLRQEPRYVNPEQCISCGDCAEVCPVELPDAYQQNLTKRKAAYKVSARAIPDAFVIDRGPYCDECQKCAEICPTGAINLAEQPRLRSVQVGAIILALGFQVYDPTNLEELGYRRFPNVMQAMEYERLASRSGPTEGMVTRPSDGQHPGSIAWLQCIGSRSQEEPFCSSICCMYATKEAILAQQRLGDKTECTVFVMDERAFNKEHSEYFAAARERHGIRYLHCRVSDVREDPATNNLTLKYVDAQGDIQEDSFELVVLATGVQPPQTAARLADILGIELNQFGFCETDKFTPLQTSRPGVFVCGAFSSPKEIIETIIDASGAAGEAMRFLNDRLVSHPFSRELPFLAIDDFPPERENGHEAPRVGLFACTCGGSIAEVIDLPALANQVAEWAHIQHASLIDFACFPEGLAEIEAAIEAHSLDRLVIAACSNRTHEPLFQRTIRKKGINPYLLELVNLRDQCSRVHEKGGDLVNLKAAEMLRLALERVRVAQPVRKKKHRLRPSALVIGGGASGMTAALTIADSGYHVHLVEREEMLGGNLNELHYVAEGYQPQRLLRDLVNRVQSHTRITTYTRSELIEHRGHVGYFRSRLRTRFPDGRSEEHNLEYGVVIVATGAQETRGHPWLDHPHVITQRQLEQMVVYEPEEIANLRDVVMVQCMGPGGVAEYCSRVCCTNTMKNALRLRLFNPECNVTVLYKNIITYGFREAYYTEARQRGVNFVRWTDEEPPELRINGSDLELEVRDLSLNRTLVLPADLVPISMSIAPSPGTNELAQMLRVPLSTEGFFEEAQLKLRPMDFMREGVFLAGMAHFPKFVEESISHGMAAAARALPLLSQESLHLGGVVAQVDPAKCVGCLTCTRTCPFEIPRVIQQEGREGVGEIGGAAFIDDAQCQGCGTCTGECPANAIQLVHYTDEQIMLPAVGGLGQWGPGTAEKIGP